jgi:hypothetical protein
MELKRKPYQGVWNIVRFNWPFYVVAGFVILLVIGIAGYFSGLIYYFLLAAALAACVGMLVSLVVSHYIYDRSRLYDFDWLDGLNFPQAGSALTVNAGFDETTSILQHKFPSLRFSMADFYDPHLHTEPSIERARKIYPPKPEVRKVNTADLPYNDQQFDLLFVLLSAHEIRNPKERILFFSELKRVLRDGGIIIVMEHLRDLPNFLAYTIGFFHFHSHAAWIKCFELAGLKLEREEKQTAFISLFILTKK